MPIAGYVLPGQIICPIVEKDNNGILRQFQACNGTMLDKSDEGISAIYATIMGKVHVKSLDGIGEDEEMEVDDEEGKNNESNGKKAPLKFGISVENRYKNSYFNNSINNVEDLNQKRTNSSILPELGDSVLARVLRLSGTQANVEILAIENQGNVRADGGVGVYVPGETGAATSHASSNTISLVGANSTDIGEGFGGIIRSQDVRETERDKIKMQECFRPGDIIRANVISLGDGTNYYLSTARNELGVIFANSKAGAPMIPIDWQTMRCTATGETESRKCAKPDSR